MYKKDEQLASSLLSLANITIDGPNKWDITVKDTRAYSRAIQEGSMGLGDSYVDGWWECEQLEKFFELICKAKLEEKVKKNFKLKLKYLLYRIFNYQTLSLSKVVAEKHYNLGNDLFEAMLDPSMTYSCGYWKNAQTLEQAQQNKYNLICNKIFLKPGMKVLDIGCGWGGFAAYACENYGVEVVGVTLSKQQHDYARERYKNYPMTILLKDYRELNDQFDRIISIGMFEHVGVKNYKHYFEIINKCLKNEGLFLLHTIGSNISGVATDPWINKYIFPNGMLPSIAQIGQTSENLFVMEDWHNFSYDYYITLMEWHKNFLKNWDTIKSNYSETFKRMWTYYLLQSAGTFSSRQNQLWQIVFSKQGVPGGYTSLR